MQRTVAPAQQIIQVYVGTGQGRVIRQQADMGTRMGAILYRTLSLTGHICHMPQIYFYLTDTLGSTYEIDPYATANEYAVPIEPGQPDSPKIVNVFLHRLNTGHTKGPICMITLKCESGQLVPVHLPRACTVGQSIMVLGFDPQQAMVLDGNGRWVQPLVTLGQLHNLRTSALLVLSHQRWANGMVSPSICRERHNTTELARGRYKVRVNFPEHPANALVTISTVGATNGDTWNTCTTSMSSAPHSPGADNSDERLSSSSGIYPWLSSGFSSASPHSSVDEPNTEQISATASSSHMPWRQPHGNDDEDGTHD